MNPRSYQNEALYYEDKYVDKEFVGGNSNTSPQTDSSQESSQYNYSADLNSNRVRDVDELSGYEINNGTETNKEIVR